MHEIISFISAMVLFVIILWTSSFKFCMCSNDNKNNDTAVAADCDFTESYDEIVTVSVQEPVYVITYKWCLDIPPRCPDNKQDYRTVHKNITIPKTRTVKRCCKNQIQLYENCVEYCTEDQCPNIQCTPGTDMCKCKSGFKGHLCRQRCDVGHWGAGCKNVCHRACSDCDHRTGCCYTAISGGRTPIVGLKFCVKKPAEIVSIPTGRHEPGKTESKGNSWVQKPVIEQVTLQVKLNSTETTTQGPPKMPETRFTEMSAEGILVVEEPAVTSIQQTPKTRTDSDGFVGTVTTMQVTVYKYDELVTKLIWISVMTVVSIAMVFVTMFVIFFNCYGVSKLDHHKSRNQRNLTSILKNDDTYKQNLSHIPPDRYTKAPVLHASNINTDFPIHPETFCPVFSAPHYTGGSAIYDSPQPLYEILC
ncbi:EMI domain [Cinara cedri]|uniref:EMI domain n=1 Tax=Cinara cedri TaxID=506608 RepID=A0A5E4MBI2_9HEMI|nr:EMI domain [Cinara cedri]